MDFTILVVDDELEVCLSLCEILEDRNCRAIYETNPGNVISRLEECPADLIIMDIRMPGIGGIDLLRMMKRKNQSIPVIIISGHATIENAVTAMKYGALNVFTKPLEIRDLMDEIEKIKKIAPLRSNAENDSAIITADPVIKKVLSLVERAAPTDATVLITGESGTGKEMIAKRIQKYSQRKNNPYIKINCAAIPETLLESEMFGHEKGAFTDAKNMKNGLFEIAAGGTIFLDEIGDMSVKTQAKMLRVLQEKQFTRIGGTEPIATDCRVIAATNKDLNQAIIEKKFREDLFYRLSVIHLALPPLRDRPDDVPLLLNHFLKYFSSVYNKKVKDFSPEVKAMLLRHDWPGNIRELKNFVERSVIFSTHSVITFDDIPDQYKSVSGMNIDLEDEVNEKAKEVILQALQLSDGKKKEAARLLKIDRKTLYNRMKKYNIT